MLQETVVKQRAVVHIGEGGVGDGGVEQAAQHVLHLGGPAEEELGGRCEQLEAHLL